MSPVMVGVASEPLLLQEYVHGNCGGCMKIKILTHPDTFLRQSTEEIEFPLSEENNIILDNMITPTLKREMRVGDCGEN